MSNFFQDIKLIRKSMNLIQMQEEKLVQFIGKVQYQKWFAQFGAGEF